MIANIPIIPIMEGCLVAKLPYAIQNRFNKVDNNCAISRKTRRETKEEHRNTIRNKRSRGSKVQKAKDKKYPDQFNT